MTIKVKSTIYQMILLLIIGGILTILNCYATGSILAKQSSYQLSKIGGQAYSLPLAGISLLRELGPVTAGWMLAFLAPIISVLSYLGIIKKTDIQNIEKSKILTSSKFISIIVVLPILAILGSLAGTISAYQESGTNLQVLFNILDMKDVLTSIFKGVIFGAALATIGIFQIKQFFKRPNIIPIILITIVTIIIGFPIIILLDVGTTWLFYFLKI